MQNPADMTIHDDLDGGEDYNIHIYICRVQGIHHNIHITYTHRPRSVRLVRKTRSAHIDFAQTRLPPDIPPTYSFIIIIILNLLACNVAICKYYNIKLAVLLY